MDVLARGAYLFAKLNSTGDRASANELNSTGDREFAHSSRNDEATLVRKAQQAANRAEWRADRLEEQADRACGVPVTEAEKLAHLEMRYPSR